MAFTRHFMKRRHFVYSRCSGTLDDQDLRVHILSFQVESKGMGHVRELLDFRPLQRAERLTVQGLIEICELERQRSLDRDFRLAMLTAEPRIAQLAEIYARVIETGNLKARVFGDALEPALTWLGYDRAQKGEVIAFVNRYSRGPAS